MPIGTNAYRNADKLTGGQLAHILNEARTTGESFQAIARQLYADHGVAVSAQTVANWLRLIEREAS